MYGPHQHNIHTRLVSVYLYSGLVVLPLEVVADLGEARHAAPAGLELAAAGHAVAPALEQHHPPNCLHSDFILIFFFLLEVSLLLLGAIVVFFNFV